MYAPANYVLKWKLWENARKLRIRHLQNNPTFAVIQQYKSGAWALQANSAHYSS